MRDTIFNIQQFADGGDAGEGAGTTGTEGAEEDTDQVAKEAAEHAQKWNELIRGEFKDDHKKAIEDVVKKRFAHQAELEERVSAYEKLGAFLGQRYNTEDPMGMLEAIMKDDAIFEKEAAERGLDTEQFKQLKKLEFERGQLEAEREELARRQAAEETYADWIRQADALKAFFPDFDLETELADERFVNLLQNNIDLKTAYQVCHQDDIMIQAMQQTAKNVAQGVTNSIRSNGMRPLENGIGTKTQPVKEEYNFKDMSLEELRDYAKQAKGK